MNSSAMVNENDRQALDLLNKAIKESNGEYDDILICIELKTALFLENSLNARRSKAIIKRQQIAIRELDSRLTVEPNDFKQLLNSITSITVNDDTEIIDEYLMGGEVESKEYSKIAIESHDNEFEVGQDTYIINFSYYESDLEVNEVNYVMRNGVVVELMDEQEEQLTKVVFNIVETK